MTTLKENYTSLQEKHTLPSYDELNNEFEISQIEKSDFPLRDILRKIAERIEALADFCQSLLQPEASHVSSVQESRGLSESERTELFDVFKKLMKSHRSIMEVLLQQEEAAQASLIKELLQSWPQTRDSVRIFVTKAKESWDKEFTQEHDVGYFG